MRMEYDMNNQRTPEQMHQEVERVFRNLLPQNGRTVREEQIALCHAMLDALLQNNILLCDAGTGIGKTDAYLTACILLQQFQPARIQPVVISTSSVALQDAILKTYLPFLSHIFLQEHIIFRPIRAVVRKGKERFVCDELLAWRLNAVREKKKNAAQLEALRSLQSHLDLDTVTGLSSFDRKQVCIPKSCPRNCAQLHSCRYRNYLRDSRSTEILVQICNHNYLLADAEHRLQGIRPLLNDYRALIIDEAHKLPEAASQMYSKSLSKEDFAELCILLAKERFVLTGKQLELKFQLLLDAVSCSFPRSEAERTAFVLTSGIKRTLGDCLSLLRRLQSRLPLYVENTLSYRLETTIQLLHLFYTEDRNYVLYLCRDGKGSPVFCTASRKIAGHLRAALWDRKLPVLLTSGTLAAGGSFDRIRDRIGLSGDSRVHLFTAASPFRYEENCLLYLPVDLPNTRMGSPENAEILAQQICRLIEATCGHTLALFPSYHLMSAVFQKMRGNVPFPLFLLKRHSPDALRQFRQLPNAILFASGSCWEGVDFPGDMVSSLIIARLPFPIPDPISKAEQQAYSSLQDYIRAVVVPDMQQKLRQGFGRAIRTETDTCVVSILDHRALPGQRYHQAVLDALPAMPVTGKIEDVKKFIREKKSPAYFQKMESGNDANPLSAGAPVPCSKK